MEPNKNQKESLNAAGLSVANIFVMLAIASIIVAIVFWAISLGRNYQASSIEKKLKDVKDETLGMGDLVNKADSIYAAEQLIPGIDKKSWSAFLGELSAVTTKDVSLSEMSTDDEANISLTGATTSYNSLAKFMASLRGSSKITGVVLKSASLAADQGPAPISFSLSITPSSDAFNK